MDPSGAGAVLVFVEDPGAANYVADLPAALAAHGVGSRLLAAGAADGYLRERGHAVETVGEAASADALLAELRPALVLVGTSENPDSLGLSLVDAARRRGIESVGVVDAFANAAYRFRGRSGDPLAHVPDWVVVPDGWTRDAFTGLGVPAGRAVVCGHPHYDRVRGLARELGREGREAVRRRVLPAAGDRPVLVFVAEISTGLNPEQFRRSPEYTLHGRGGSDGRTEVVLEELLDAVGELERRPYLVLRLHPKNSREELAPYAAEFDLVSTAGSPLELVYAADLTVGMTSMLLLEAQIMGGRTLSVVPRETEREWLPSIRSGRTPCVSTRGALRAALPEPLSGAPLPPPADGAEAASGSLECVRRLVCGRLHRH